MASQRRGTRGGPGLVTRAVPEHHGYVLLRDCQDHQDDLEALSVGIDPQAVRAEGGSLVGLDVRLRSDVPTAPSDALRRRWSAEMLDDHVIGAPEEIADEVSAAMGLRDSRVTVADASCADHDEALDFSRSENVTESFFYLYEHLHRRRVRMLADVVAAEVQRVVARKGSATVLDVGPGPLAVLRCVVESIPADVRERCTFRGIDVSEELLRLGVHRGWLDRGVVADLGTIDGQEVEDVVGEPDVVILSEVLEHIAGSASVFARTLLPWLRKNECYIVGSVPNSIQGVELLRVAQGEAAPHQLTRHLFDEKTGHVAFYTYRTLSTALHETWGLQDTCIWSNGIRVDPTGAALCYDAAVALPHRGDRLCFAGRC